ncbi:MAG: TPM domain-containing protein [Flexibacteraceae bacterium]
MKADSFSHGNLVMHFTKIGEMNGIRLYNSGIVKGLKHSIRALVLILAIVNPNYSLAQSESLSADSTSLNIPGALTPGKSIYDFASVLSDQQLSEVEENLAKFQRYGYPEITVVLVKSTGFVSVQEFAYQLADRWGISNSLSYNHILILISTDDGNCKIACNDELEPFLPKKTTQKVLQSIDEQYFKKGQFIVGINEAITKVSIVIDDEKNEKDAVKAQERESDKKQSRGMSISVFSVILLFILYLIFRKNLQPKRKKYKGNFGSSGTRKWGSFGGSDNEDRSWQDNSTF